MITYKRTSQIGQY